MSPARTRAGRGTWKAGITLAVIMAIPATGFAWGQQSDAIARPEQVAKAEPAASSTPTSKKKTRKRKPTIEEMIRDQFGKRAKEALRIAHCESKFDPAARSRAGARGVFQIMPVHAWRIAHVGGKDLSDARTNIRVAQHLFKDEGWRPWVCARVLGLR